jgi:hypothetical protein
MLGWLIEAFMSLRGSEEKSRAQLTGQDAPSRSGPGRKVQ